MDIQTTPRTPAAGTYARATAVSPSWLDQNKQQAIRLSVIGVAALFAIIVGSIWAANQAEKAQNAFSDAMDVYDSPIQQAGQPPVPNAKTYPSAAARAKDANPLFRAVADKYSWFRAGDNARYFAGLTAEDLGNTSEAEADLKKAAETHDAGLASLAKMALASLYINSGQQAQAFTLYRGLIDHPTATVSANAARLALAGAQETSDPQAARVLYAKVKDTDKTTAAGQIASQRLGSK